MFSILDFLTLRESEVARIFPYDPEAHFETNVNAFPMSVFVIPLPEFFIIYFLGVYRFVFRGCVVPGADANNRSSEARRDACVPLLFARAY